MKVGLRIKEIRERKQMSQLELSEKLKKLNQSQICKIEKGKRALKAEELKDIAEAFGVSVAKLIT